VATLRRLVPALLLASAGPAAAVHFETTTGAVVLQGSSFSYGFEAADDRGALAMFTRRGMEVPAADVDQRLVGQAIEGQRALAVGGTAFLARINLAALGANATLHGRRVEIKYWHRAQGLRVVGHLSWTADGQSTLSEIPFQLTGRATDDGWQEWSSGPFDYSLAGTLDASSLIFYSNGFGGFGGGGGAGAVQPTAWIDAVSLDDLGPAQVPEARCTLASEATACGTAGACYLGRCVDAIAALGPVLQNPALRADYLRRRAFEYTHLEGGRLPQSRAAEIQTRLEALIVEPSAIRYREGLLGALQLLEDGHASPPTSRDGGAHQTGICLHLGVADLIAQGELPLVFALSGTSSIAARLQAGDALVSLDGLPVDRWAEAAARYVTYYGDQRGRKVVAAPDLMTAAAALGSVARFVRPLCTSTTAPVVPCAVDERTTIELDFGALQESTWQGRPPSWTEDSIACDYRFHRAFPGPSGTDYEFAGSLDQGAVRVVQINGVPGQGSQGGAAWAMAIDQAFADAPSKILLDQRTGYGGGIDAVDLLASKMVGPSDFDRMHLCPRTVQPVDEALISVWRGCQPTGVSSPIASCGDFIEWPLGMGQTAIAGTSSVAVLIGYDVSGNDFLSRLLTFRRSGATRIFGGAPTAGAFGVIWSLPAVSHEISGGSIQVQDTIFRQSSGDLNVDFQTGHGVPPDVVILQRQSDARRDIDTVFEAARAWLNP